MADSLSAAAVAQALGHLRVAMRDAHARTARELGLTAPQAELLCAALRPAAVGRLADTLRCDRTNITHLLERASARGWVQRRGDEQDRRSSLITLTPDGERLAWEFLRRLEAQLQPLVATWPEHRQRTTAATLHEIATELDRARETSRQARHPTPPTAATNSRS